MEISCGEIMVQRTEEREKYEGHERACLLKKSRKKRGTEEGSTEKIDLCSSSLLLHPSLPDFCDLQAGGTSSRWLQLLGTTSIQGFATSDQPNSC